MRCWTLFTLLVVSVCWAADEKPSPEVEKQIKLLKSTSFDSQMNALKKLSTLKEKARPALKAVYEVYAGTKSIPLQKKALETAEAIDQESAKLAQTFLKEKEEGLIDTLGRLRDSEDPIIKPLAPIVIFAANKERLRSGGESLAMPFSVELIAKYYAEEKETKTFFLEAITLTPGKPRGYSLRAAAVEHVSSISIDKKLLQKALDSALAEPDAAIREICCRRLGELGVAGRLSLTKLRQLAQSDQDEDVREAAKMAVKFLENAK